VLPTFAVHRPSRVEDAVGLLSDDALAYHGGTELLLALRMGLLRPAALVDLKRVDGLDGIRRDDGQLLIGAGTSHDRVARDPLVREYVPLLAAAEGSVGNARVRAQGTLGGNICFAEPRSDVTTVLIALDATLRLVSPSGSRTVPVAEFVQGPYWTVREPDELLVEAAIPLPAPSGVYLKFQTAERPTVGVAAVHRAGGVRLVVGAVGELPLVSDHDDGTVDPAEVAARIEPVADLTGSVAYKRHVTEVYVRRALDALRAGEHG
jgi:aerobic carbon-monoxide dehydrogenase medium subunit